MANVLNHGYYINNRYCFRFFELTCAFDGMEWVLQPTTIRKVQYEPVFRTSSAWYLTGFSN
jgi:hypothetical protein